jgi:hypothetical protein
VCPWRKLPPLGSELSPLYETLAALYGNAPLLNEKLPLHYERASFHYEDFPFSTKNPSRYEKLAPLGTSGARVLAHNAALGPGSV